jgi:serine phosphatase RsbU (regulator of sigma subunit)
MSGLSERPFLRRFVSGLSPFRVLARKSRRFRAGVVSILFVLLAAADLVTSPDVSFLAFYFLPVLFAAWYLGPREGLLVSMASVSVFVVDDFLAHRHYSHPAVPFWNRSVELAFFIFFSWLVGTLRTALEREVHARTERLDHDLAVASEVQAALLPPRRLDGPTFSAAAECRQAFGVGGDAWDVVTLGGDAVSVTVADVSGKGIPAALLMAGFLGSLRGLLPANAGCLDVLASQLSDRLRAATPEARFVTAFIGVAENGSLRYVNAGHEAGLLLPPAGGGAPQPLPSTGPPLGILPGARFREARVPLPPGAMLVLYTDGLTECEDPEGGELGRARVARLAAAAGEAPDRIVSRLIDAAVSHAAGAPLQDDVTVLCLTRKKTSGGPAS